MKYTLEQLEAMTPKQRRNMLTNNQTRINDPKYGEAAKANIDLLKGSGLKIGPLEELRDGDWQLREIELIINDPTNEAPMLDAVAKGYPPLGAIEHKIVAKLGDEYLSERRDTVHSGDLVAKRLYALGYDKIDGGEKAMPSGSVAKRRAGPSPAG
jgi:hypothetical protein